MSTQKSSEGDHWGTGRGSLEDRRTMSPSDLSVTRARQAIVEGKPSHCWQGGLLDGAAYFFAVSYSRATSVQFTTFHHALR